MIGLREDQQVRAQLVGKINALFYAANGLCVASGLAPRWAAQQPHNLPQGRFWYTAFCLTGAASRPNAGQARSPQGSVVHPVRAVAESPAWKPVG